VPRARGLDGTLHVLFAAHVADHGQRLAAGGFDLGGRGVHGAGQLGMGLVGFGQQHHVGPAPGRGQPDRQADTPASAGNHHSAVGECARMHRHCSPLGRSACGIGILFFRKYVIST
jgi:hypothetical protein